MDDPRFVFWHSIEPGVASFGPAGVITEIGLAVFGRRQKFPRVPGGLVRGQAAHRDAADAAEPVLAGAAGNERRAAPPPSQCLQELRGLRAARLIAGVASPRQDRAWTGRSRSCPRSAAGSLPAGSEPPSGGHLAAHTDGR
jgi:hypothetical protein